MTTSNTNHLVALNADAVVRHSAAAFPEADGETFQQLFPPLQSPSGIGQPLPQAAHVIDQEEEEDDGPFEAAMRRHTERDGDGLDNLIMRSPPSPANISQPLARRVPTSPPPPPPAPPQRPAIAIVRPIPQRVAIAFYEQGYEMDIPASQLHSAVLLSHEWHRKWTQQEETGHGYHETSVYNDDYDQARRNVADQYALDRQAGAKNPSPEQDEEDEEVVRRPSHHGGTPQFIFTSKRRSVANKRGRHFDEHTGRFAASSIEEGGSVSPLSQEDHVLNASSKRVRDDAPQKHDDVAKAGDRDGPVVIRPVALRVARPAAVQPPDAFYVGTVPKDIASQQQSPRGVSPLTAPTIEEQVLGRLRGQSDVSRRSSIESSAAMSKLTEDLDEVDGVDDGRMKNVVHIIEPDDGGVVLPDYLPRPSPISSELVAVESARHDLLHSLAAGGGEPTSEKFLSAMNFLEQHFAQTSVDTNATCDTEGMWLTLTKPTFFGQLGVNDQGDPLYTLGRMTFDMFCPTNLVCSLQGNFNTTERVTTEEERRTILQQVPKSLHDEVESGATALRTYNIITAFTIEPPLAAYPDAPNKDVVRPIKGIMSTYGYTLPDPEQPNRQSVWITGGKIEPNDDGVDLAAWTRQFELHPPSRGFGEQAKILAVKLLMGAEMDKTMKQDGSMEYRFNRPLGGHGLAYVDTLYVDRTLRIVRGHRGTIFVFNRLPENKK